jgi:hypothetical protein
LIEEANLVNEDSTNWFLEYIYIYIYIYMLQHQQKTVSTATSTAATTSHIAFQWYIFEQQQIRPQLLETDLRHYLQNKSKTLNENKIYQSKTL